jgi:hypothetical protein
MAETRGSPPYSRHRSACRARRARPSRGRTRWRRDLPCGLRSHRTCNLAAISDGYGESRNNYDPFRSSTARRGGRGPRPITRQFRFGEIYRNLRLKNFAMNYQGFCFAAAKKPDKTRILRIHYYRQPHGSRLIHRERHSGHPWRWIECSAGIGPHGAVAVGVVRRVLRYPSPSRWRWA